MHISEIILASFIYFSKLCMIESEPRTAFDFRNFHFIPAVKDDKRPHHGDQPNRTQDEDNGK